MLINTRKSIQIQVNILIFASENNQASIVIGHKNIRQVKVTFSERWTEPPCKVEGLQR